MYSLSVEGLYLRQSYAAAVVLLILVICINALSSRLARKIARDMNE
jgi:phosphate transport system permease protein